MIYVALLRGINVGGNNLIKMTDLAAAFTSLGMEDVRTYIQSGNVLFSSPEKDRAKLEPTLETALSQLFQYEASLVLRTGQELESVVKKAPPGFGSQPDAYRYDVLFLKDHITAADALQQVSLREGVDQAFAGDGVLYFSRLVNRLTQSRLSKIASMPVYKSLTIRNWNTTTKLLALIKAGSEK